MLAGMPSLISLTPRTPKAERAPKPRDEICKCTIYLRTMDDFGAVNAVYQEALGDHRPARATVAVAGLPRNVLVEIDAICAAG